MIHLSLVSVIATISAFFLSIPVHVFAAGSLSEEVSVLLVLAVILVCAKIATLVEKVGQPGVLGEIIMGIILGNLGLIGIHFFDVVHHNEIIHFLAELGVIVLLFQIGLESNIREMLKVGPSALLVAVVGIVVPFVLGVYVVGPYLLPGYSMVTYLFLGAALTATSVGITARVFKDVKMLQIPEAQIVLGAAVIDDVLGLVLLAVVSGIATTGTVAFSSIFFITLEAFLFLGLAVAVGRLFAPYMGRLFSKIQSGAGMKLAISFSFALVFAYAAQVIGLASIVGAFAAGLVLDSVCFRHFRRPEFVEDIEEALVDADERTRSRVQGTLQRYTAHHIDELIAPVAHLLVPIFFVIAGMSVNISLFFNSGIIVSALIISVVAVIGKVVSGFVVRGSHNKWLIGWGMVPRGEVGLIFATLGASLGVLPEEIFAIIVFVVIVSTLIAPPMLSWILKGKEVV